MQTDAVLIQRVLILDDRKAYSALVQKYQSEIRTYLFRLTRNREWADDLAQESFLAGYRVLSQLQDSTKFRSWLLSVAHSQFLQWRRRRKTEVDEDQAPEAIASHPVSAHVEVESLLKSLREDERAAVILCLAHEFSHSEAAELLKVPIGTVKSLVLRARQKIREQDVREVSYGHA